MTRRVTAAVRDAVLPAFAWNAAGHALRQTLSMAFLVIQARVLSPADFGLVALAAVAIGLGDLAAQLGMPAAIVHRRDLEPRHLSSAFWLCAALGVGVTVALALGAPAIARLVAEPRLAPVLAASSVTVLLAALSAVPNALRVRDLKFDAVTIQETSAMAIGGLVGTLLAWRGFGVWSLVGQSIATTTTAAAISWRLTSWRPAARFDGRAARELARFGIATLATNLVHHVSRHGPDLLVGRFLGATALGLYSRAYAIMLLPLVNVSAVLTRVLFPSLARMREDPVRVAALFLGVMRGTATVTVPMMLGLLVTVEPFVLTVFGPTWAELIPILRFLVPAGILYAIAALAGSLFLSQGRADVHVKLSVITTAHVLVAVATGLSWGLVGVAACSAVAVAINAVAVLGVGGRLVGLRLSGMARTIAPALAAGAVMAVLVWLLGLGLPGETSPLARLAGQVTAGLVIYIALVGLTQGRALRDAWRLLAPPGGGGGARI